MGGNLYKLPRVTKEKYFKIVSELKPVLDKHFGDRYRIPKAYKSKETYGDLDIILDAAVTLNTEWLAPFRKDLGITEVKKVRGVVSMVYDGLQVDFFLVKTTCLETTYNFMSYNILGNLLGRIFHKFNIKYGSDGLIYVLRSKDNHISKEVVLSRDTKKIFDFLKLDYKKWENGFDTVEDIYDYVYNSHYFSSISYKKENAFIKKKSERPEFLGFIKYLNQKEDKVYAFSKDKNVYIPMINDFFPEAKLVEKYEQHILRQERINNVTTKFNGRLIMKLIPELNGKALGSFISEFKNEFNSEQEFEQYIIDSDQNTIDNDIINSYNLNFIKNE